MMRCMKCMGEIPDGASSCPKCGAEVPTVVLTPPPAPPAPGG